jgi:CelD/BcsL family acetyltransferase involved in cellulose biosynthesis
MAILAPTLPAVAPNFAMSPSLRFDVSWIQTREALCALRPEWEDLLRRARAETLCLSIPWLDTWLQVFPPAQLFVLTVRDDAGHLVAAAPWQIAYNRRGALQRTLPTLQWIGCDPDVVDWAGIPMDASLPETARITIGNQLAHFAWQHRHLWQRLRLRYALDGSLLQVLAHWFERQGCQAVRLGPDQEIPLLALPDNIQTYRQEVIARQLRRALNNARNRLRRSYPDTPEFTLRVASTLAEEQAMLAQFVPRYRAYWQQRGEPSDFDRYGALETFYQRLLSDVNEQAARAGQPRPVVMSGVVIDGQWASLHVGSWSNPSQAQAAVAGLSSDEALGYMCHMCSYDVAYSDFRPGLVHFDLIVEHAMARRAGVFEFGRGGQDYKKFWTKATRATWQLDVLAGRWSRLANRVDSGLQQLKGKLWRSSSSPGPGHADAVGPASAEAGQE